MPGTGITRDKYVDLPFVFLFIFDSVKIKDSYFNDFFFNTNDEEYSKRKEHCDFYYTEQYEEKIINDYEFFKTTL